MARSNDHILEICEATWQANKCQKHYMVERILNHFKDEDLRSLTVAIWGLTFKPKAME